MNHHYFNFISQIKFFKLFLIFLVTTCGLIAQNNNNESINTFTLDECIEYALQNNAIINNSVLNEEYTETTINSKLSEWYPQLGLTFNYQHNFKLPTSNFNGRINSIGSENTSGLLLGVTQTIFNKDALLASQSADEVRQYARQKTKDQKINLAVLVSKTFYEIILLQQQMKVVEEDIVRNNQSAKDALYQYQSGIVDKTDYKRATIALNNSKSQKVFTEESLKSERVYLKQLMGFNASDEISLKYNTDQMEKDIYIDTTRSIDYDKRIEIQQLETQKKLQKDNLNYYKYSFLPSVYLFGNYNLNYLNDQFSNLYNITYPSSFVGVSLSLPIFQGGKRFQEIKGAEILIKQVDNDITNQKQKINTQYQSALSEYKGNLNKFLEMKENLTLAKDVYDIIQLQYKSGVKTFLDVITAESDLKTSQINYFNAYYKVLSSKIDVEQSLGNINYN